jgi:uncharacterized protein with FMN-binding domain
MASNSTPHSITGLARSERPRRARRMLSTARSRLAYPTQMSSNESSTTRISLLTLGTAAAIAVYAAGYLRTRGAADAFAAETGAHRPPHIASAPKRAAEITDSLAVAAIAAGVRSPAKLPSIAAKPAKKAAARRLATANKKTSPTAVVVAPTAPTQPASSIPEPAPVATAPVEPPKAAEPPRNALKDGVYRGYGTSRHGDIEAEIEVKDGRIAAAKISQCLTRYSCSWISQLPSQVVARQSAEVDYVSGATESSDAFYLAVAEAISKAK